MHIQKTVKSKDEIQGSRRHIRLENMWLLYNYDTFVDWFWTRKSAKEHAIYQMTGEFNGEMPEHYQILRGTINITLEGLPPHTSEHEA